MHGLGSQVYPVGGCTAVTPWPGGLPAAVTAVQPRPGQPETCWPRRRRPVHMPVAMTDGRQPSMSQRPPGSPEPRNQEDWPDDLWSEDDEQPGQQEDLRWSAPPPRTPRWPGPDRRRRLLRLITMTAVALAAGLAGAGAVALAARDSRGVPATAASPGSRPSWLNPAPPGSGGVLPGPGSGVPATVFVIGRVTSVTNAALTITGPGRQITASFTGSTRVTGSTSGEGGIKVGDLVSAELTRRGGRITAIAIQDPARAPAGFGGG